MTTIDDAVLLAATAWPGSWTAEALAGELALDPMEVEAAVEGLRNQKLLNKRRGNPNWGGTDRLRASKAGRLRIGKTVREHILAGLSR